MNLINDLPKASLYQRLQWIADPIGYMETAALQYPDLFTARILDDNANFMFVQHPGALQQILSDRASFSSPGEENMILKPLLGEYSIIMLSGDRHHKRRKLLMPSFHGAKVQNYADLIVKLTHQVMQQLPKNQTFTARSAMQEISLQVIVQAVFGLDEGEKAQQLKSAIARMSDVFRSPLTSMFLFFPWLQQDLGKWSLWGNFLHWQRQIDQLIYQQIADRRAHPDTNRHDILSLLMEAQDEDGNGMTPQELRDELMTLLFAGHETTATAMAWALYWIHSLPEVKAKLLEELALLGDSADAMEIFRLPYLTAVCQETLRIYPVGMLTFPRKVEKPVELLGYHLEPGTIVTGCIYLLHQREDIYPDAKQFKPERFLEKQPSPYEFMSFGGGDRRCIGEALAMLEMKLVIATILGNYQLNMATNKPEVPQRRGITLAPRYGVRMKINMKQKPY